MEEAWAEKELAISGFSKKRLTAAITSPSVMDRQPVATVSLAPVMDINWATGSSAILTVADAGSVPCSCFQGFVCRRPRLVGGRCFRRVVELTEDWVTKYRCVEWTDHSLGRLLLRGS